MQNYNYIDLFHGIGGFAMGAHLAGMQFKNHFCSDVEPYCQKLYALRFPDSVQLGDIRAIDTDSLKQEYGERWIISGGFPCQDISVAGKGAGIHGERSGLWFEYWRLIRDLRPRFAIIENVGELIRRGLLDVLRCLAEIGYSAEWQVIPAGCLGAHFIRERFFIVAYDSVSGGMRSQGSRPFTVGENQWGRDEFERLVQMEIQLCVPAGKNGGVSDGIPSRVDRLKGLGNAVVPQIAGMLFGRIKESL